MAKKLAESPKALEIKLKSELSPLWVDNLFIGMRDDNLCFLRFAANLPEGRTEQAQIMTSKENLKNFTDVLCSVLNYYPIKKQNTDKN